MGLRSFVQTLFGGNHKASGTVDVAVEPVVTPEPAPEPAPGETLPEEIEPRDVKALMDSGEKVLLIDVRTPREWEIVHLEGAHLIPLDQVHANPPMDLDREARIIVHCHHGMRSYDAMWVLKSEGF